jgi:tRNA (Thr-GGU) A37 N-methylase
MTRGELPTRWFRVQPIGYVRRPGAAEPDPEVFYDPRVETALEILPRWEDALAGIEDYSHLFVAWCSRLRFRNDLRSRLQSAS